MAVPGRKMSYVMDEYNRYKRVGLIREMYHEGVCDIVFKMREVERKVACTSQSIKVFSHTCYT